MIYEWGGYGFWGLLATLIGSSASICAAVYAAKTAIRAEQAANNAQKQMASLDVLSELGRVSQKFTEITLRIEASDWRGVSENCGQIRDLLAPIVDSKHLNFSDDQKNILGAVVSQMGTMSASADKAQHTDADFDPVKSKAVLRRQRESLRVFEARLKEVL